VELWGPGHGVKEQADNFFKDVTELGHNLITSSNITLLLACCCIKHTL